MDIIKILLIIFSGFIGLIGSLFNLKKIDPETNAEKFSFPGKILICLVMISMVSGIYLQDKDFKSSELVRVENENKYFERSKRLLEITKTLEDITNEERKTYQTLTRLNNFRVHIYYAVDFKTKFLPQELPEDFKSLWLVETLENALHEIFKQVTGKNIKTEKIERKRYSKIKDDGWRIAGDKDGVIRFTTHANNKRIFRPKTLIGSMGIVEDFKIFRDRIPTSWSDLTANDDNPSFHFIRPVAFFDYKDNESIPKEKRLVNMDSKKKRPFLGFPSNIFYNKDKRQAYFSVSRDFINNFLVKKTNINISLYDLNFSDIYIYNDDPSFVKGPGYTPLKVKIESEGNPIFYYLANDIKGIKDTPEKAKIFKLIKVEKKSFYEFSPGNSNLFAVEKKVKF